MSQPTFRRQFADSLAATMVLSIVCSALVWSLSLWLLSREILFRPANYHERQIPGIVAFVQAHHDQVLSPGFRPVLEGIVPLQGMDYQVLDASADLIYGSLQEPLLTSNEVWRRINTERRVDRRIVDYRPIGDPAGGLRGVFVIVYDLSITGANPSRSWSTSAFAAANMAAPFLFFLMFALIFARRIGKRLEPPVARLIDAADRIRRRDLEFTLAGTVGSKELAEVAGAFEAMRQALRQALIERWRIERERREMVAAITHDLRTPLSVIQGHVDTLLGREDRRADRLERYLQTIRRNAERRVPPRPGDEPTRRSRSSRVLFDRPPCRPRRVLSCKGG